MKALVTGATGFVGSAVVRELVGNGEEVKVLVRPTSDRRNLKGLAVEVAEGDITDLDSIRRALAGCDRVYHVAALYTMGDPAEAYYRVNVEGSRQVFRACMEAGIARVVYTSTIGAVGASSKNRPADEETVWDLGDLYVPYVTTKYIAEFEAYRAFARGLPVVIVNPCAPMGARDRKPTPTGKLILDFLNGKMPVYPPMHFNVVDVDDVARGHRLAMEKGRPGERYILGSDNVSLKQVLMTVSRMTGVPAPRMAIPYLVGVVFSFFAELVMTGLLRRPTLFTLDGARFVKKRLHASNRKAVTELGWTPAPFEACLRKAIRWYHEEGYLQKPIRLP
jgi:dihydroflavonol-4-reductase